MRRGYAIGFLAVAAMLCAGCEPNTGIRISVNPITKTMTLRDHTDRKIKVEKLDAGFGDGKFLKADLISAEQDTTTPSAVAWQGMNEQMKIHGENLVAIGQQLNQMIGTLLPVFQKLAMNSQPDSQTMATMVQGVIQELSRTGQLQNIPQAAQQNQPK